jgi:hypothetical protein
VQYDALFIPIPRVDFLVSRLEDAPYALAQFESAPRPAKNVLIVLSLREAIQFLLME